jgi:hypothetical protein
MGATHFGPYRLDTVLSRGAVATVYRARDTSHHDRVVALKVFDQALSADPAFRARFRRDAGLLSALREPHVVPIHRHGEIDGRLYLDMRLVRGPSLADVLRDGPLAPPRAEAIAGQIGAAMESLRRTGLGDRPLERADVLLTGPPGRGEFVQLVGMGLGRPPVPGAAVPPEVLVSRPARRRRGRVLMATAAVVAVAAAVLATVVAIRPDDAGPAAVGQPGLVATIPDPAAGIVDADIATSDGRQVLVAATVDGSVHTWDVATGREIRPAVGGAAVAVASTVVDGGSVLLVRNRDTTVAAYALDTGAPIGPPLGTPQPVAPDAPPNWGGLEAAVVGGAPVAVTTLATGTKVPGSYGMPEAQIGLQPFPLGAGAAPGPVLVEEGRSVSAFALTEMDGRPVVVSIVGGSSVQARDLGTGAVVGVPTAPQPAGFAAVTTAVRDGVPVAVTAGNDNTVRTWDLRTGEEAGSPLVGHTARVAGVAAVRLGDRTVIVSTTGAYPDPAASEVRFWDLATGAALGAPLVGHPLGRGFVAQPDDGRGLLAATPRRGEQITVWDVDRLAQEVAP